MLNDKRMPAGEDGRSVSDAELAVAVVLLGLAVLLTTIVVPLLG